MTFDEYTQEALRTAAPHAHLNETIAVLTLGLAGEAGEVADLIKKYLGHGYDFDRLKLQEELGDVLWYLAVLSNAVGLDLLQVAKTNIVKLKGRYPDGFETERSKTSEHLQRKAIDRRSHGPAEGL